MKSEQSMIRPVDLIMICAGNATVLKALIMVFRLATLSCRLNFDVIDTRKYYLLEKYLL